MAAVLAAVFFLMAFVLYAVKATTSVPWTPEGFTLLGFVALTIHVSWTWWGTRPRP